MDVKLVVFDLDGTLIGAPEPFSEIKGELKSRLLGMGIPEETMGDLTPMYESLLRIARETGRDFDELYSILVELETERIRDSFLFDGVTDVLDFLRERGGVRTAIMTRSSRSNAEGPGDARDKGLLRGCLNEGRRSTGGAQAQSRTAQANNRGLPPRADQSFGRWGPRLRRPAGDGTRGGLERDGDGPHLGGEDELLGRCHS